jgi:hypothetical protein
MFITWEMDLDHLAERMGAETNAAEAKHMRRILCEEGWQHMDTADIPETAWLEMLESAVRFAEQGE